MVYIPNNFEDYIDTGDACQGVQDEIKEEKIAEELVLATKKDNLEIDLSCLHYGNDTSLYLVGNKIFNRNFNNYNSESYIECHKDIFYYI